MNIFKEALKILAIIIALYNLYEDDYQKATWYAVWYLVLEDLLPD